jgi:hypothetical protein
LAILKDVPVPEHTKKVKKKNTDCFSKKVFLKGQSHEKVGEIRVEGDSLGPN